MTIEHRLKTPMLDNTEGQSMNTDLVGYVDTATALSAEGWITNDYRNSTFWAVIDGQPTPTTIEFFPRNDLIEAQIDGYGFRLYFRTDLHSFNLKIGHLPDGQENLENLKFLSFTREPGESIEVQTAENSLAVLDANDLLEIEGSIEKDSITYLKFLEKYGSIVGIRDFPLDVLFIDGTNNSVSVRYRIINISEGLKELGYTTRVVNLATSDIASILESRPRTVVFFRTYYNDEIRFLYERFKSNGARIIYDIDDLAFNTSVVKTVDGLRFITEAETRQYLSGIANVRRFMTMVGLCTASTDYLTSYITQDLGIEAFKVRNSIGRQYRSLGHTSANKETSNFRISYYSGTKTHQRDFTVCSKAVLRFLSEHKNASLQVVGLFDFSEFPEFEAVSNQISLVDFMPFHLMMEDMSNANVILAPLEIDSPYCEAKSELKFFEAALSQVPCIASGTQTYTNAMDSGKYGIIANDEDDWYQGLIKIYKSKSYAKKLGKSARDYCIEEYSHLAAAKEAAAVYFGRPVEKTTSKNSFAVPLDPNKSTTIAVLIPDVVIGGGGHRKILSFCKYLAKQNCNVSIFVDTNRRKEDVVRDITEHFFDFQFDIKYLHEDYHKCDIVICTHWSTAYHARNISNKSRVIYFVQDYEPMFYEMSSNSVKAQYTYSLGFHMLCYGNWISDRISREIAKPVVSVPFSMNKEHYSHNTDCAKSIDVLFFARPSQPRRCFELGVEALRSEYSKNNTLRIALYGENEYGDLGFPYHNFGLMRPTELKRIYNMTHIGMCFSTTNPSLVGYEMIACGAQLIDIKVPGYEHNFNGDAFVGYCDPDPDQIGDKISEFLIRDSSVDQRIKKGIKYIDSMADDEIIGEYVAKKVEEIVGGLEV